MTARALAAPTTTWDMRLVCDTEGCNRAVTVSVSAINEATAQDKVRAHAKTNDGWTSDSVPSDHIRGLNNVVDACRGCANQKAGWQ